MRFVAYGTHLHPLQLLERIESTRFLGTSELIGWTLKFNALGDDGSGKCTLEPSASSAHVAVYDIHGESVGTLESMLGKRARPVNVDLGALGQGVVYVAEKVDHDLRPLGWYRDLVLLGARYHGLPDDYVARIESERVIEDSDHVRRARMESLLERAAQMAQLPITTR